MSAHGVLVRTKRGQDGVFGQLVFDGVSFHTAEPPTLLVPALTYDVRWDTIGRVVGYELQGVQGRTNIQIHVGNWAGDVSQGLLSDSEGCILLGLDRRVLNGQAAIGRSEQAIKQFHELLKKEPWLLTIVEAC